MTRAQVVERLLNIGEELGALEELVLERAWERRRLARQRAQREDELLLGGVADGKYERLREAQLRQDKQVTAIDEMLEEMTRQGQVVKQKLDRVIDEQANLRAAARLLSRGDEEGG